MVGPLSPVPIMTETSLRYAGDTTDAEWGSPDAHQSNRFSFHPPEANPLGATVFYRLKTNIFKFKFPKWGQ